ncbi:hypothetical protein OSI81_25280, partial [Mycobacterium ulcerans]
MTVVGDYIGPLVYGAARARRRIQVAARTAARPQDKPLSPSTPSSPPAPPDPGPEEPAGTAG